MNCSKENIDKIKNICASMPGAYEARPFGEYPVCYKVMGKIFAQLNPKQDFFQITVKTTPDQAQLYRQAYPGVIVRGYHCPPVQQPHWNTIHLSQFESMDQLVKFIEEAYDIVVAKLTKKMQKQLVVQREYDFVYTDGTNKDFVKLCGELDSYLYGLIGKEVQSSQYDQYNLRDDIHDVLIVYKEGEPVACGSFKPFDDTHVELKRVFTKEVCRGQGIGKEVVHRLEARAKIQGYTWCILETGNIMESALITYEKLGFKPIPNFPPYENMEQSVCMSKKI